MKIQGNIANAYHDFLSSGQILKCGIKRIFESCLCLILTYEDVECERNMIKIPNSHIIVGNK